MNARQRRRLPRKTCVPKTTNGENEKGKKLQLPKKKVMMPQGYFIYEIHLSKFDSNTIILQI